MAYAFKSSTLTSFEFNVLKVLSFTRQIVEICTPLTRIELRMCCSLPLLAFNRLTQAAGELYASWQKTEPMCTKWVTGQH